MCRIRLSGGRGVPLGGGRLGVWFVLVIGFRWLVFVMNVLLVMWFVVRTAPS